MEKVLPEKANKEDMKTELKRKADTTSINKTMAEIAENIESRVSYNDLNESLDRRVKDLTYQIQNKVSFDEFRDFSE
jgi:hypothetical protein